MASYNKVNGTFASENVYTLHDILRKEWGFDGVVMSDWFGTQSTVPSVNAGLNLEMPGPSVWRGEKVLKAIENGEIHETTIDESVRRLLHLITKAGLFSHPEPVPEQAINRPEHQLLAREAAAEGIVLLKNKRNILPLQSEKLTSLAIIGPNAKTARIMAGAVPRSTPIMPSHRLMVSWRRQAIPSKSAMNLAVPIIKCCPCPLLIFFILIKVKVSRD